MLKYNIYSDNLKVNKRPMTGDEVKTVLKQKYINKFNDSTGEMQKISTNNLHIIKCYVV